MDSSTSAPLASKLFAISGTLAVPVFLFVGFVFHAWAWAWVVFLVPGMVRTWQAVGRGDDRQLGQGHGTATGAEDRTPPPPTSYEGEDPLPPQRYQG